MSEQDATVDGAAAILADRDLLFRFVLLPQEQTEEFRVAACHLCATVDDARQRDEGCRMLRCGLRDASAFAEEQAWFVLTLSAIWPPSEVTDEALVRVNEHLMRYGALVPGFVRDHNGHIRQGVTAPTLRGELHRALVASLVLFTGDIIRIHADDTMTLAELGKFVKARRTVRKRWLAGMLRDDVRATSQRSQAGARNVPRSTIQSRLKALEARKTRPGG